MFTISIGHASKCFIRINSYNLIRLYYYYFHFADVETNTSEIL